MALNKMCRCYERTAVRAIIYRELSLQHVQPTVGLTFAVFSTQSLWKAFKGQGTRFRLALY